MKNILNKRYFYYICLVFSLILLPLCFTPSSSHFLILGMMLPPIISWIVYIEYRQRQMLQSLQTAVNNLSDTNQHRLATTIHVSVKNLSQLNQMQLTHKQLTHLRHFLNLEV